MTATTPINGLPYYLPGDPADIAGASKGLAEGMDTRAVPRFATTAARDIAIPSPIIGQVCVVGGDFQVRISSSKWQSVSEGLIGSANGPSIQTDRDNTFASVVGISVPMIGGRAYEVHAMVRATQITSPGFPTVYIARNTDGTNEITSAPRLVDGSRTLNAGQFINGEATALITPGTSGTLSFYVCARSTDGAARFAPNSCYIRVKDIGAA